MTTRKSGESTETVCSSSMRSVTLSSRLPKLKILSWLWVAAVTKLGCAAGRTTTGGFDWLGVCPLVVRTFAVLLGRGLGDALGFGPLVGATRNGAPHFGHLMRFPAALSGARPAWSHVGHFTGIAMGPSLIAQSIEDKRSRDTESNGGKTLSARLTCGSLRFCADAAQRPQAQRPRRRGTCPTGGTWDRRPSY